MVIQMFSSCCFLDIAFNNNKGKQKILMSFFFFFLFLADAWMLLLLEKICKSALPLLSSTGCLKKQLASHPQLATSQPQHSASPATPFLPATLPTHMQAAAFPVPVTGSGLEHMAAAVSGGGLEHHVALASLGQDAGVHGLVTKKRVRDSSDDILLVHLFGFLCQRCFQ